MQPSSIGSRAAGGGSAGAQVPATLAEAPQAELHPDWQQAWFSAIGGSKPFVVRFFDISSVPSSAGVYREIALHESNTEFYSRYLNCPQDAFRQALDTLKLRTQQFGEMSSVVQNWIEAQKTVFENCSAVGTAPGDLPPSAPAIARADRAYQQAAAYFYAGEYDEAVSAFRAIAEDQASPWSTIAPYLVARALVRKATVIDKWEPDFATLGQAETQIDSVLANPRLTQYHHAAERLRGLIEFRLHPDKRLAELANNLMRGSQDADLAQDVTDFRLLFNRAVGGQFSAQPQPIGSDVYAKLADARAKSDLLDWMLTLRLDGAEAYTHSLEKWEATHSPAWLVAALTKADATSPHLSDLLAAARRVPTSSPAHCSVTFHSLRLLLLQGKDKEARERLAALRIRQMGPSLEDPGTPPSTVNLFLAMRFALAQNLGELFENAPRLPATITDDLTPGQLPVTNPAGYANWPDTVAPRFDDDSLVVLNRFLPLAMLAKVAHSPQLPERLRHQVALAAWTRAILLGNTGVARSLTPDVESIVPNLAASIQAYQSAGTPEERRFAAALATLRFPGLSPFVTTMERSTPIEEITGSGESWWDLGGPPCVYPQVFLSIDSQPPKPPDPLTQWPRVGSALLATYPGGQVKPPAFLTAADRAEAAQESSQLVDLGRAPNYLSRQAIAWAKTRPGDPRVPEVLALAVRSTRWGCRDKNTGQLSKAAFELLHRRYPKSSWAEKTKYWFK
jgi:tetratricopeptide (TPR) repeat protein